MATLVGMRHLADTSLAAPSSALGRATGGMTSVIFVLLMTFVAGMTRAARGVAALDIPVPPGCRSSDVRAADDSDRDCDRRGRTRSAALR